MNLEYNITEVSDGEFVLTYEETNYLIGEVVYELLKGFKQGKETDTIIHSVKKLNGYEEITIDDLNSLVETKITPIFKGVIKKTENPVKSLFIVFRPKNHIRLFEKIKKVFIPKIFWTLFILLIVFTISILFIEDDLVSSLSELRLGWGFTLLFSVFVILFHEIGHVTASTYYKETPKEVGFGIYFIYPAFYTDLSSIWKLNNKQRIIISLGGIYFQLFLNVILFILMHTVPHLKPLWVSMLFSNTSIMFFNLNPLFKFDGYWIFSDYFEIPNLRNQSIRFLASLIGKAKPPVLEKKKKIILAIYSIIFLLFMMFVWFAIFRFLFVSSLDLINEYKTHQFVRIVQTDVIKKIFFFLFILVLSVRMISSIFTKKTS